MIEVNSTQYFLVHAGIGNFKQDKALTTYIMNELVWTRPNYDQVYFQENDSKMIVGSFLKED